MKTILKQGLFAIALTVGLTSCSNIGSQDGLAVSGQPYKVTEPNGSQLIHDTTAHKVSGVGTILFTNPLPGGLDKNKINTEFTIDDGGQMVFEVNADTNAKNGIYFFIRRIGKDLQAEVKVDANAVDISAQMNQVFKVAGDGSFPIGMQLQVHNDEKPLHLIISTLNGGQIVVELNALTKGVDKLANGKDKFLAVYINRAALTSVKMDIDTE